MVLCALCLLLPQRNIDASQAAYRGNNEPLRAVLDELTEPLAQTEEVKRYRRRVLIPAPGHPARAHNSTVLPAPRSGRTASRDSDPETRPRPRPPTCR